MVDTPRTVEDRRQPPPLELLRQAAARETGVGPARARLLQALVDAGLRQDALALIAQVVDDPNLSADACDAFAFSARRLDRHDIANGLYQRAVALAPADGQLWYNLASSERNLGRLAAAAAACEKALERDPRDFPSLLLRSDVVRATPAHNHVPQLQDLLAREPGDQGRMFVAYALGKELNDLGRYDDAFSAYAAGSALRRRNLTYDVRQDEAKLARIREAFSDPGLAGATATADAGRGHIFIIGLPRSGTTLVERILSGLPGVRSNGETENFSTALARSAPTAGGDVFERFAHAPADQVAALYEALAAPEGGGARVIEKLPLNYLYAGAIARALPKASIVLLRRHPLDSCFAMFRTLFGSAYPFSYAFEDLARYFAAYQALMEHWKTRLGPQLIEVDYERLVAAPAAVASDLAARCGLTWSDDALDLSRQGGASLTASAAQVRGEIYDRSAGLWRAYRKPLLPLRNCLVRCGVDVPDA